MFRHRGNLLDRIMLVKQTFSNNVMCYPLQADSFFLIFTTEQQTGYVHML